MRNASAHFLLFGALVTACGANESSSDTTDQGAGATGASPSASIGAGAAATGDTASQATSGATDASQAGAIPGSSGTSQSGAGSTGAGGTSPSSSSSLPGEPVNTDSAGAGTTSPSVSDGSSSDVSTGSGVSAGSEGTAGSNGAGGSAGSGGAPSDPSSGGGDGGAGTGEGEQGSGGAPAGGAGGSSDGAGGMETGSGGAPGAGGAAGEEPPCVVDHGGEIPSLREKYANHFAMGVAIDTQYSRYSSLLTKHYNSVTAEDQMKFDALQPSEGNFSYGTADQMVNYAVNNGMQVRGHALVWHRQTPSWVFNGSRDQVLQRMKNHINAVMQHFQGKVGIWDVVNEAIMDDGSFRSGSEEGDGQSSGWYGALGESYIAEAFIAARAADPTAKLFYNDYYNYHPARRQAIYELLAGLIEDGVPVDGVGLQAHLNLAPGTDPSEQSYHQTVENMEEAIEMYSSLGLEVQVTELDISVYLRGITYTPDMFYTPATFTPEIQEQQAERYREFFDMFRRHSDVITSLTTWGISDDNTWLSEFSSGRQDFPLLFDAQQQPKPAFWAVVDFCE